MSTESSQGAKCAAEFVGTFILMFSVGCNVLSGNKVWGSTSCACALMVSIYGLGGISGANFNPAVSLSLGLSKMLSGPGIDVKDMCSYFAVQAVGVQHSSCLPRRFGIPFRNPPHLGATAFSSADLREAHRVLG